MVCWDDHNDGSPTCNRNLTPCIHFIFPPSLHSQWNSPETTTPIAEEKKKMNDAMKKAET